MMTEHLEQPASGPYATAAPTYWRAGWHGILPLPPRRKKSPPDGYTGREGAWPSYPDIQAWTEDQPGGNIALRLPPDVLGVDVDHYGAKPGGAVLQDLEQRLGALPATWRSTSRDDGVSGIRLYRIPAGLRWPGILGPGIETLRHEHRYAVAWPSIHPDTGGTYRWITPNGAVALNEVPTVDELPDLPAAWIEHFTHGELATDQPHADLSDSAAHQWITGRDAGLLPPCRHMGRALERGLADLTGASSRHDTMLQLTNRLVWLAGEGHVGSPDALARARQAFLTATAGDRDPAEAAAEWDRMVTGAVRIAAAAHPAPSPDPCDNPFAGLIAPKDQTWTSSTASGAPSPLPTAPSVAVPAGTTTAPAPAPPAPATAGSSDQPTPEADEAYELARNRAAKANVELEHLRARQAAQRLLELEDEEQAIADRVRRRLLDDKAALAYREATEPPAPGFDAGTLADVLARPADPPMRIDGLLPWTGSGLVVAQRKTGKTTLLLNYARCLLTGEPFLGEFDVIALDPDASVAFLNYEVSAAQLARWADEVGVPRDRLYMVNLRGRRNPLGRADDRAELAALLREKNVQAVIVDPFGRAYTGISQNDNGEVQTFLVTLEEFVRAEVGALDLLLATHAGWDGERTRGASALEDWGDTIITLTRDADDESRRFMKAMGRDVDVDEDELVMDPLTRVLTRTGNGSRKAQRGSKKAADLAVFVARIVDKLPAGGSIPSKAALANLILRETDYQGPKNLTNTAGGRQLSAAIERAEASNRLVVNRGPKGDAWVISRTDTTATQPAQSVGTDTTTTPVGTEGVVGGGPEHGSAKATRSVGRRPGKQTPIAGGKYVYDADTKSVVDPQTGEIVSPEASA